MGSRAPPQRLSAIQEDSEKARSWLAALQQSWWYLIRPQPGMAQRSTAVRWSRSPVTWAVSGTALLVLLLSAAVQLNLRQSSELARLRTQLAHVRRAGLAAAAQCTWQQDASAGPARLAAQLTDSKGGAAAVPLVDGATAGIDSDLENESAGVLSVACRVGAFLLMAALLALAWVATKGLDHLPAGVSTRIHVLLQGNGEAGNVEHLPLSKVVAYKLDVWFSTNPYSKTLSLLYLTLGLVYVGGLGIYAVSGESIYDAFWQAIAGVGIDWTFADEVVEGGSVSALLSRIMAVAVSIGGMLVTALMLGIVSETIGDKIEDLKKGKSDVLENGHTLILGWSDKLLPIVDQLCNANESEGGKPIVILAERDKQEMEEDIDKQEIDLRGSSVICRSGNPLLDVDLKRVSVQTARSIIVLAFAESPDQSDARVLRVVLSLMGVHDRLKQQGGEGLRGHVVAEICDVDNEPLVQMVGGSLVHTVVSHDIIGRLMIQSARQPGLASVWEQIMGFEGDEFYIKEWPELTGRTFGEALLSFPAALPLGIKSPTGKIKLNPPDSTVIEPGDELLVLAEDDDSYEPAAIASASFRPAPKWRRSSEPERVLFVGWRRDMDDMIAVMDAFVAPGSELWLYNEVPTGKRDELLIKGGLDPAALQNLRLVYKEPRMEGDLVNRKRLEELRPERFSSVLILADDSGSIALGSHTNIADTDSRSLASLLLLRDIQTKRMAEAPKMDIRRADSNSMWYDNMASAVRQTVIISEILDSRTRHLIQDLQVSEFVLSNELVSMALAMVSENADVNAILAELFTEEGNELYVHPAARYLHENEQLTFWDVMLRGRERQEIIIGYRNYGMACPLLNPKDKNSPCISWSDTDAFIVVAESCE